MVFQILPVSIVSQIGVQYYYACVYEDDSGAEFLFDDIIIMPASQLPRRRIHKILYWDFGRQTQYIYIIFLYLYTTRETPNTILTKNNIGDEWILQFVGNVAHRVYSTRPLTFLHPLTLCLFLISHHHSFGQGFYCATICKDRGFTPWGFVLLVAFGAHDCKKQGQDPIQSDCLAFLIGFDAVFAKATIQNSHCLRGVMMVVCVVVSGGPYAE